MINIYDKFETNFDHNGLVVLDECIYCTITEKLNADYTIELQYPLYGNDKYEYIVEDNIIKAPTPRGTQLFRIYRTTKNMNTITACGEHIFIADMRCNFLESVKPTSVSGTAALNTILSNTQYPHNFIGYCDIDTINSADYTRKTVIEALLSDDENSFINKWGGERLLDNFNIKFLKTIGTDKGVTVQYGKNLTDIEEEIDLTNIVTRVMPTGVDKNNNVVILPEKYIDSPYINNYPCPAIKEYHFDDVKEDKDAGITLDKVYEILRQRAKNLFEVSKIDVPFVNYRVNFVTLSKIEEYKNYSILETIYLGDKVTIKHKKLGIDIKAEVISYTYDAVLEKYTEIELGNFMPNYITQTQKDIKDIKDSVDTAKSDMQKAINNATGLITGNKGGYVVFHANADGQPYEILIMDTDNINTAQKVWRWNKGGLGYSSTGYDGKYETAVTQDGSIVATFITAGILDASLIKTGTLTSLDGKFSLNLSTGKMTLNDVNGNKSIEFDDTRQYFYDWDDNTKVGGIFSGRKTADATKRGLVSYCENGKYLSISYKDGNADNYMPFVEFDNGGLGNSSPITFSREVEFQSDINGVVTFKGTVWSYGDLVADANCYVHKNLTVNGSKNCVQRTQKFGDRLINAYETAEYFFGDLGIGVTDNTGICKITIDEVFKECVNTNIDYHVFLQKRGAGDLWGEETTTDYFIVKGTENLKFSWELKAKRSGFEDKRLEIYNMPIASQ